MACILSECQRNKFVCLTQRKVIALVTIVDPIERNLRDESSDIPGVGAGDWWRIV